MNKNLEKQRLFVNKLYARCSHSTARPSMADKGVQVSLVLYSTSSLLPTQSYRMQSHRCAKIILHV